MLNDGRSLDPSKNSVQCIQNKKGDYYGLQYYQSLGWQAWNGQLQEDTGDKVFPTERQSGLQEKGILEDTSSIVTCVVQICMAQFISEKALDILRKQMLFLNFVRNKKAPLI